MTLKDPASKPFLTPFRTKQPSNEYLVNRFFLSWSIRHESVMRGWIDLSFETTTTMMMMMMMTMSTTRSKDCSNCCHWTETGTDCRQSFADRKKLILADDMDAFRRFLRFRCILILFFYTFRSNWLCFGYLCLFGFDVLI